MTKRERDRRSIFVPKWSPTHWPATLGNHDDDDNYDDDDDNDDNDDDNDDDDDGVCSFLRFFLPSFVRSFVCSFVRLFVRSLGSILSNDLKLF